MPSALEQFITILVFVYGLCFGSFLNVVAYRVPRKESIVRPPSHCPSCNRRLRALELIPVLSWLFLLGRCRTCKSPISIRYPLMELATATLFVVTQDITTSWPARVAWFVFWLLLMAVVGTDFTSMRVPNVISLPGFVVLLILSVTCHVQSLFMALLGSVVGYGVLFLIHLLSGGKMGMGDAKLYLSIGAMLGPWFGLETLALASFSGTLIGLVLRGTGLLKKKEFMPFVPHIAIGVIVTVFYGHALNHWYFYTLLGHTS